MNLTKITKTIYKLCEDLRETMMDLSIYYQHSFVQVPFHSFCWQPIQSAGEILKPCGLPKDRTAVLVGMFVFMASAVFSWFTWNCGSHLVPGFL